MEKRALYRAALVHRGLGDTAFLSFVVEATGRLGNAAGAFLDQVLTYLTKTFRQKMRLTRYVLA